VSASDVASDPAAATIRDDASGVGRDLGSLATRLREGTVEVTSLGGRGSGSGVIWDASGLVITNAHVVPRSVQGVDLRVILPDRRNVAAHVVARDRRRDLALLAVNADRLPSPLPIGEPAALRPGQLVVAMGHPFGIVGAVALGVVHALDRYGAEGLPRWVCADIRLAPGNSGGPLVNAVGQLVGINAMIIGGLGFAVSTSRVGRFLADVAAMGRV
jgi:serine protease Do